MARRKKTIIRTEYGFGTLFIMPHDVFCTRTRVIAMDSRKNMSSRHHGKTLNARRRTALVVLGQNGAAVVPFRVRRYQGPMRRCDRPTDEQNFSSTPPSSCPWIIILSGVAVCYLYFYENVFFCSLRLHRRVLSLLLFIFPAYRMYRILLKK